MDLNIHSITHDYVIPPKFSQFIDKPEYVFKEYKGWIIVLKKMENTVTNEQRNVSYDPMYAEYRGDQFITIVIMHSVMNESIDHIFVEDNENEKFIVSNVTVSKFFNGDVKKIYGYGIHYYKSIYPALYSCIPPQKYTGKWFKYDPDTGGINYITLYDDGIIKRKIFGHPNGIISDIKEYAGENVISHTKWDKFGQKKLEICTDGTYRIWHDNGELHTTGFQKHNILYGHYVSYYNNKQKQEEGEYINNEKDGEWVGWHKDGTIRYTGYYKNGKKIGKWIVSSIDERCESEYVDNVLHGKYITHHGNEQISSIGEYVYGKREGEWRTYYENGNIYTSGTYINDNKVGKWQYYYQNGQKELEGNFVINEKDGMWKKWYITGNIEFECSYTYGVLNGPWIKYYQNGDISEECVYTKGKRTVEKYRPPSPNIPYITRLKYLVMSVTHPS